MDGRIVFLSESAFQPGDRKIRFEADRAGELLPWFENPLFTFQLFCFRALIRKGGGNLNICRFQGLPEGILNPDTGTRVYLSFQPHIGIPDIPVCHNHILLFRKELRLKNLAVRCQNRTGRHAQAECKGPEAISRQGDSAHFPNHPKLPLFLCQPFPDFTVILQSDINYAK